jgi:hypothetical protein
MIEGLFADGKVFSCVRVDVICFHVVAVDKSICFVGGVVPAIIFEALSVEILPEGGV